MEAFWGSPIIRIIVFWGLYWGPPFFGKLPNILVYVGFGELSRKEDGKRHGNLDARGAGKVLWCRSLNSYHCSV